MIKRGHLNVPVIGVAKADWNVDQLRARARDGLEKFGGGVDAAASKSSAGCCVMLMVTIKTRRPFSPSAGLGLRSRRPALLAIPPALFGLVVEQLAKADCTKGARVVVEKPFGHDLASAQALNEVLLGTFRRGAHLPH